MAGIVALRGIDSGCGCSGARGFGADASASPAAVVTRPPMSTTAILVWSAAIGTAAYIFWGTLQPKSRRLVT